MHVDAGVVVAVVIDADAVGGRVVHVAERRAQGGQRDVLADHPGVGGDDPAVVPRLDRDAEDVGRGLVEAARFVGVDEVGAELGDRVGELVADHVQGAGQRAEVDVAVAVHHLGSVPEGVVVVALVVGGGDQRRAAAVDAVPTLLGQVVVVGDAGVVVGVVDRHITDRPLALGALQAAGEPAAVAAVVGHAVPGGVQVVVAPDHGAGARVDEDDGAGRRVRVERVDADPPGQVVVPVDAQDLQVGLHVVDRVGVHRERAVDALVLVERRGGAGTHVADQAVGDRGDLAVGVEVQDDLPAEHRHAGLELVEPHVGHAEVVDVDAGRLHAVDVRHGPGAGTLQPIDRDVLSERRRVGRCAREDRGGGLGSQVHLGGTGHRQGEEEEEEED